MSGQSAQDHVARQHRKPMCSLVLLTTPLVIGEQLFLFFGTLRCRGLGSDHNGLVNAALVPENPPDHHFGRCANGTLPRLTSRLVTAFVGACQSSPL